MMSVGKRRRINKHKHEEVSFNTLEELSSLMSTKEMSPQTDS